MPQAAPRRTQARCGQDAGQGTEISSNEVRRREYAKVPAHLSYIVVEVGPKPFLGLLDCPILAPGVVLHLVAPELPDAEVFGIRMIYVPSAHAAGRRHGAALGQAYSRCGLDAQETEEDGLFRVVGARGISRGGPYAAVSLPDKVCVAQILGPPESTSLSGPLVEHLRHRLGQAVAQGLAHDRV